MIEPPCFAEHDRVYYAGAKSTILTVNNYCMCCDRYLDEPQYSIVTDNNVLYHKVPESRLKYLTRG